MLKTIAKTIGALISGAILLTVSAPGWAEYEQVVQEPPPVEQPLIREGTLAVNLLAALNLGTTTNEVEAETVLGEAGIAPKNGWIADYPVTPDIVGELAAAVGEAADNRRIAMSRDEAVRRLYDIVARLGVDMGAEIAGNPLAADYGYEDIIPAEEVYDYYYDAGPPIVTYYSPPPAYYYLYSWVPYPFWCNGFRFGGFFILNDFNRPVFSHHGRHHRGWATVTNHFRGRAGKSSLRIDPLTRSVTPSFAGIGASGRFLKGAHGAAGGRPESGFTARPPRPRGNDGDSGFSRSAPERSRVSPWAGISPLYRYNSDSVREGRSTGPGSRVYRPGVITRDRGHAPVGSFNRSRDNSAPAATNFNRFHGRSSGSPPTGSFTRGNSPPVSNFSNSRGYSSPARSFAPRGGNISSPSFRGSPGASPSFRGGSGAAPSFRGGHGFSGSRGRR
jgi:hypothetical protein